ncbi:hypothetical protein RRG08_017584 [Elysia crispata]|uniref:Uncharacterized protein n=1 Tax=Elysia crispata TaxID=231223 RepID=A0AAE0YCZ2_9GAST|nr:hypothetical protein RRG08_017584 [Elysia crispata]
MSTSRRVQLGQQDLTTLLLLGPRVIPLGVDVFMSSLAVTDLVECIRPGVLGVGTDVNDGVDSHFGQIMRIVGKSVAAAADDDDDDDDDVSNVDNDYRGSPVYNQPLIVFPLLVSKLTELWLIKSKQEELFQKRTNWLSTWSNHPEGQPPKAVIKRPGNTRQ